MRLLLEGISHHILELAVVALVAFALWGCGYIFVNGEARSERLFNTCVSAGLEWVKGDCVK